MKGMAAGQDGLFWTNRDAILYCPRSGCTAGARFDGSRSFVARIATDDANIYWTEYSEGGTTGGAVKVCPQTGCGTDATVLASDTSRTFASLPLGSTPAGLTDPGFLAVDQGWVYFSMATTGTQATPSVVQMLACPTAGPCPAPPSVPLPSGMIPRLVHHGVLYGTILRAASTSSLVSCPATAPSQQASTQCDAPTTVVDTLDVQSVAADGDTLYFDAIDSGVESIYRCPIPCVSYTTLTRSHWPGFAVRAGILYAATATPAVASSFATCPVASCPSFGPAPLDLPFTFAQFQQAVPAPTIVGDTGGAYAYGLYVAPDPNVGLSQSIAAIVRLPMPSE
jgi:hypothetical protein